MYNVSRHIGGLWQVRDERGVIHDGSAWEMQDAFRAITEGDVTSEWYTDEVYPPIHLVQICLTAE